MLACLILAVSASRLTEAAATLDMKERPVSKVIGLLRTMQEELQKEGEADKELYDKLSCWCETNGKDKTLAIATAERTLEALGSEIQETTAKSQELEAQIAQLAEEIAKNEEALDKASAMRAKDLAAFNAEDKEMLQTISALRGAVTTLSKHHSSFLQADVHTALTRVRASLTAAHMDAAARTQALALLQQPAGFQSYAPASGQIFGILKQMKETFENNMSEAQKNEEQAAADFAQLKAAKTEELASANSMKDAKTQELADTNEQRAAAKQNAKDTQATLEADQTFLADLKERCANADAEFEERSKARQEEIMAVGEALEMLNSDDAHDLFGSTLGFAQLRRGSGRRAKAVAALAAAAHRTGSKALAALASTAQLDAFTKVLKAIDDMVVALKQEQQDEVKHRDFCIAEFAENDKQQAVAQDELADLTAEIENLKATLDTLTGELADANAEVKETSTQMKRAGEDRELENTDFQQTVADQRAAQEILTKVLNRLKQVYGFTQTSAKAQQQPEAPEGFGEYKQNKHSGGVLGMIQQIIDEAHTMEMDALRAEQDSQAAYEDFVKNSNDAISTLNKAITDKTEKKATAEARLVQANEDRSATLKESDGLNAYKADLHSQCDFVMENFEVRQSRRADEMEALGQAKAILSGA